MPFSLPTVGALHTAYSYAVEPPNDERRGGEEHHRARAAGVPHLYEARAKQEEMHAQTRMPPSPLPLISTSTYYKPLTATRDSEADCYGRTVLLVYLDAARTVSPGAACLPPPCPPMGACCCCRLSLSLFIWYRTYPLVLSLERAGSEESESFFADSTRDNWELKIRKQVDSTDTCSPSLLYTCRVLSSSTASKSRNSEKVKWYSSSPALLDSFQLFALPHN
jgi:hypothetical protein